MHKSNDYEYHTPPHLPPLSVSLPSQTRPEPDLKSKLKPQSHRRDLKMTRLEPEPQPQPTLDPKHKHRHQTKDLKKTRLDPKPEPALAVNPDVKPNPKINTKDSKKPQPEPEPEPEPEPPTDNDTALVAVVEKYYSPLTSPLPVTPDNFPAAPPPSNQILQFSRREEVPPTNSAVVHGNGRGVRFGGAEDVVRRSKKEGILKRVGLGVRVLETVFCLISFSVMAADQTQGWSGDSFYRYKEYRFTVAVTVFGFVYAAFQAYDLGSYIATGKQVITHRFRGQFDFFMDQIIAYLLISASSSAASRVDDWQANWGKDAFTAKASASISMAFLAFICFALSSLISGYNLCNHDFY